MLDRRKRWAAFAALAACAGLIAGIVLRSRAAHRQVACSPAGISCDRVLVGFRPGTSPARIAEINARIGATVVKSSPLVPRLYVVRPPVSMSSWDAVGYYTRQPEVDSAMPDLAMKPR